MIDISGFKGETPKISYKLLPNNAAEVAQNCDLETGRLAAINGVTIIQDVLANTQTIYRMTSGNFLQWTDEVNVVKALVADSGNRILYTGDGYPKETNAALALGSSPYPTATRRLGIPAPTNTLTVDSGTGTPGSEVARSCSYVYTIIGTWADGSVVESGPSKPTAVTDQTEGLTYAVSGFVDASTITYPGVYTTGYRIYRLNSGDYGAEYQFVADILKSDSSYSDIVEDADLGEVIPSTYWTNPESDLSGLIATSHGLVFGFVDNTIYPSEVFIPYSFPATYSLVTESDIIGMGYTGSMVVVLTETVPYLFNGQDPATMSIQRLGYQQPCVSARSIVSLPGGVVYASPDGLYMIGESGVGSLLTKNVFTKTQWTAKTPANLFGFYYNESYYGFFSGTPGGFRFDLETGSYEGLVLSHNVYGGEYCPEDDLLYLIKYKAASSIREIVSFGTGSTSSYTWKSKGFSFPHLKAVSAAMVEGDFSGSGSVVFNLYVDGALSYTKVLTSAGLFRITPELGSLFQIELTGTATIDRIIIGPSVTDIMEVLNG